MTAAERRGSGVERWWTRVSSLVLLAASISCIAPGLAAQRGGGGRGRGMDPRLFGQLGGSNEFYAPPAFHGNPAYDGRFVFARIKYRGFFAFGPEGPGWAHDYPDADEHFMKIMKEVTILKPFIQSGPIVGGAIVALDDPELFRYPVAYLSEPGGWYPTDKEVEGLRHYMQKGGFLIFDDFNARHFMNAQLQMSRVLPGAQFVQLTGAEPIFDSFFKVDLQAVARQCAANRQTCYRGIPKFWGLFKNNDPKKRLIAIFNVDADIGEFWQWSGTGWAAVDVTNEAFKLGVNFIIYALTH